MFWFTNFVARYTRRGFRELQKHLGELNGVMEETISGQQVVKAFRRNESAIAAFRQQQPGGLPGRRVRQQLRPAADAADQRAGQLLRDRAGRVGRLAGAAGAGHAWASSPPSSATGSTSSSRCASWPTCTTSIQAALAGAERVFEIIDTPPEVHDAAGRRAAGSASRGDVRFEHVAFRLPARHAGDQGHDAWRPRPGRPSRWWGRPARARRRSSTC